MVENCKSCQIDDLIAQNERLDALNATQKTTALFQVTFSEKNQEQL